MRESARRAARWAVLLALVSAVACSSSNAPPPTDTPPTMGSSVSKIVGPEGGSVQTGDGHATVTIPAGALSAPVNVTLAPAPMAPTDAIGVAWSLGPEGTSFAAPVKLELDVDSSAMPPGVDPSWLTVARLENGQWNPLVAGFVQAGSGKAVALTRHFSVYAVVYKRCTYDAECAAPAQCWNRQTCVVPCRDASDCPSPMACLGGRCALEQCNGDADCADPGSRCAGFSDNVGFCMDSCNDTSSCGGDQSCGAPPKGGSSVCQFDACGSCGSGRVCSGDICWPQNAGCRCGTPGCLCGAPNPDASMGDGGNNDVASNDVAAPNDAGSQEGGRPMGIPNCPDPQPAKPLVQNPTIEGGTFETLLVRPLAGAPITDEILAGSSGGGLWRSTDSGKSWTRVGNHVLDLYVGTLADDGSAFYAGTGNQWSTGAVYSSTDGVTWSKRGLDGQSVYALVAYKGKLWAGTSQGVFVSSDQGMTFASRSMGLPAGSSVVAIDVDDNFVWAGTDGAGAFRAPAGAGDFSPLSTGLPANAFVRAIKAVKNGTTTTSILAGVDNGGAMGRGEVYEQTDGATWVVASQGFWNAPDAYKRVDEFFQLAGTVYAGCDWGAGLLSRPAAAASTWSDMTGTVENRNIFAVAASSDGSRLYLGDYGEGVLTGPIGGTSWTRTNGGLLAMRVLSLAAGKVGPTDALFAGTEGDGVYRSLDGGNTWARSSSGIMAGFIYSLDANGQNVYAGDYGAGVHYSSDGAATWQLLNGTDPTAIGSLLIMAFAHDANGVEYAGTQGAGVWKLIGSNAWAPVNVGLTELDVESLLMAPDGQLYAGTSGGAVWVMAGDHWNQIGSGLPNMAKIQSLVSTPMGALCATFGPLACMTSPLAGGMWQVVGGGRAGGNSLALADGLIYMGGYGDVLERLDISQPCWRPEISVDSQVYKMLATPSSILVATNNGLFTQAR